MAATLSIFKDTASWYRVDAISTSLTEYSNIIMTLQIADTVEPVYSGHPWGPPKVPVIGEVTC